MRGWFGRRVRAAVAAALLVVAAGPLDAQTRAHRNLDSNGVDLAYGDFVMSFVEGSIGSGKSELALVRSGVFIAGYTDTHKWDRITLQQLPMGGGVTRYVVSVGAVAETFDGTGSLPTGSSLTGSGAAFTYRTADGTQVVFDGSIGNGPNSAYCNGTQASCWLLPTTVASPDGKTISLAWDFWTYCFAGSIEKYGSSSNNEYSSSNGDPFNPFDNGNGDSPASQARIAEGAACVPAS